MHKFVSAAKQENICVLHQKFCARPKKFCASMAHGLATYCMSAIILIGNEDLTTQNNKWITASVNNQFCEGKDNRLFVDIYKNCASQKYKQAVLGYIYL